ncbi:MAG: hypothetical protein J6S60_03935 [Oscillospiraceae bacterium]|nr:hypothetical protein [Oscillospiraceae bacterium]
MKNVNEEYVKAFDALEACQQNSCEDCPFKKDNNCLSGVDGMCAQTMALLEAMHDWLTVNHLWDDFVLDTERPLDIMEYRHQYWDALELLRTGLPRVMTLEELEQAEIGTVVWCEQRTADRCYMTPMIKDDMGLFNARHLSADPRAARLPGVRFWTSRPTDEQREATPWTA